MDAPVIVHSDTTKRPVLAWLAVDQSNGDIAIMYLDSRNDPDNLLSDCYVSYSSDGGSTWHDKRISDIRETSGKNLFTDIRRRYSGCAFHNGRIYPFMDRHAQCS